MRNRTSNKIYLPELVKKDQKFIKMNMSLERVLSFDLLQTFSENYKPMSFIMVCLQNYQG